MTKSKTVRGESLFSWEKPIELIILEFTKQMAEGMERVVRHNTTNGLWGTGLFSNNRLAEDAQKMSDAYRTIENRIKKEVAFRESINHGKK